MFISYNILPFILSFLLGLCIFFSFTFFLHKLNNKHRLLFTRLITYFCILGCVLMSIYNYFYFFPHVDIQYTISNKDFFSLGLFISWSVFFILRGFKSTLLILFAFDITLLKQIYFVYIYEATKLAFREEAFFTFFVFSFFHKYTLKERIKYSFDYLNNNGQSISLDEILSLLTENPKAETISALNSLLKTTYLTPKPESISYSEQIWNIIHTHPYISLSVFLSCLIVLHYLGYVYFQMPVFQWSNPIGSLISLPQKKEIPLDIINFDKNLELRKVFFTILERENRFVDIAKFVSNYNKFWFPIIHNPKYFNMLSLEQKKKLFDEMCKYKEFCVRNHLPISRDVLAEMAAFVTEALG